jgi:hypothetical protein
MFQCQVGISASLLVQYPQINGRFVNTILAVPKAGKAVNPKRCAKLTTNCDTRGMPGQGPGDLLAVRVQVKPYSFFWKQ